MIRVALFLIAVGLLAYGVALFADRPGDVVITWQGMRIETSLMVMASALLATMAMLAILWSLIRAVLTSPFALARRGRHRRGVRAYEAMSNGLIAIGAGDVATARKLATEANRIAPSEPLALLLSAQTAQLAGDRDGAERVFRTMAGRADTKALGLHGLFIEARRRNDQVAARAFAEEAARGAPTLAWAGRAVLEARCKDQDWAGALSLLEHNAATLDKATYQRQRAVLLTARAVALEDNDRDGAKALVIEAEKLAPTLVPAAALAGRLVAEGGQFRKANRIVERAWRANPHPELAEAYMDLRAGDAARDRLKRMEALAKQTPGHVEATLAVARAALDAQEFAKARAALEPLLRTPTKRVALSMAALERAERNDEGRAREWTARAVNAAPDPAWTADGYVSDRWLPASPVTGRLDAFEWRVPLSGMLGAPVIEPEPPVTAPIEIASAPSPRDVEAAPLAATGTEPVLRPIVPPPAKTDAKPEVKAEPIIPLVHAPDDPGPDMVEEIEVPLERDNGWRKILG
ncbi:MAG TPA: heme biosynthesis HemY N-terminal domain-containing protein [Xanthobacteraceae bacterium]|jgi:HemY protein